MGIKVNRHHRKHNYPDTTSLAMKRFEQMLRKYAEERGITYEEAKNLRLDREFSLDEIRWIVRTETKLADKMYLNARLNSKMTPAQRDFIEEIASLRHYIHSNIESMYFGSPVYNMISDYSYRVITEAVMNHALDIDIDLPIKELHSVDMENTYCKWKSGDFETQVVLFVSEFDALNSRLEAYLERIDKQFGSKYKPEGELREGHTPESDLYKIKKAYELNYNTVRDDMNVKKFTNKARKNFNKLITYMGVPEKCKVEFKDFNAYEHGLPSSITLFVEKPKSIDEQSFKQMLESANLDINGVKAVFEMVDNVDLAVQNMISGKDYKAEYSFEERTEIALEKEKKHSPALEFDMWD